MRHAELGAKDAPASVDRGVAELRGVFAALVYLAARIPFRRQIPELRIAQ